MKEQATKKMSTEEYSVFQKIRNGVEGIPSILRRNYHVDTMPVREFINFCTCIRKIWYNIIIA
ncbi:hypothetical protein PQ692_05630 [Thermoanaerobacterium thermosaccharolyticum]|uniref:hypothetical protein n=1 Tax=Thermoanaerobacterium thermosaccharolyticum TaxID=1517 RepID=UPI003DA846CB